MLKKIIFTVARYSGLNFLYQFFSDRKVFIVGYHSVFSEKNKDKLKVHEYSKISISDNLFEQQIKFLVENGHNFLHFSDLGEDKIKKIKKPTIIYFDDGFKDNILNALPILKKYNISATIFVAPKYVDSGSVEYMNWEDIRQLKKEGIEIGSHTYSHLVLTDVDMDVLEKELSSSKSKIEKEVEYAVEVFSYPKGRVNDIVTKAVEKAGYKYAITTKYGVNSFQYIYKNPYLLKKVAPRVYESFSDFTVRLYSYNIFK